MVRLPKPRSPSLLDLFCGRGGWSKPFAAAGWRCVGVDLVNRGYPFRFVEADVLSLPRDWIDSFDAVVASPPCEEFARAWLPWLRGDRIPEEQSLELLNWSVGLCDRTCRIVECSVFAARHVPGSTICGSYALWGDVPLLLPVLRREKTSKRGASPDLRAEIPWHLAHAVERWFYASKWRKA